MKTKTLFILFSLASFISFSQGSLTALTFDGVNDRVAGTTAGLSSVTNNFTIEMWINPTATITIQAEQNAIGTISGTPGTGQRYAIYPSHGGGGCPATANNAGIGISVGTNGILVYEHTGCHMPAILVYNATLPAGWNHIAVVVTAKQPRLYLNGVSVRTGLTSNMTNVFPGSDLGGDSYGWYAGNIDEVRIWNTSRSQANIRNNMCKRVAAGSSGLIRYFRLDEGTGSTIADISSSGVTGTVNGATWATSAAPIGNTSVNRYTTSWSGVTLTHTSPDGDSLSISNVSSATINAMHIYHVTTVPNTTSGITGLGGNNHYYGVFKSFTAGGGGTYTATYYYDGNDAFQASSSVADPDFSEANMRIFTRSNNSTASWTMNGTAPNTTANTFTLAAQSTEFILAFGNGLANLPVELVSFNGHLKDKKVELYWQTLSEINNQYFAVERSADGINFEEISRISGAGNSNSLIEYSTIDENPLNNIGYYRLRQVDFDGTEFYSNIISVKNQNDIGFELYPNPNNGDFYMNLSNLENEWVEIYITDITGRVVYSSNKFCENKNDFFAIELNNKIAPGAYLINIQSQNQILSQQIIVK